LKASTLAAEIVMGFPELQQTRLPNGGYVFARASAPELAVHVVFSPLPVSALQEVRGRVRSVRDNLVEIFDRSYAPILLQMNGANFFSANAFLYGWQAPRDVNREDLGYSPFDLCWANFSQRAFDLPHEELVIGGGRGPDIVITADVSGVYRLRSKPSAEIVHEFTSDDDLFRFLVSKSSPRAAS
jgi:hypothetical protein